METDNDTTAGSKCAYIGAGVPTCPAERSSANVGSGPASYARPRRRGRLGLCVVALLTLLALTASGLAQTTGQTVRHHKVPVDDPSSPPELLQAESAIEKQDYSTAEPQLKKVVAQDPDNYVAWFDLGFLDNAQSKTEDSIAAY